ncbi:MAG: hypothetical protein V9E99_07345 [Microthrixaceae bacterium]|jgi:hypothetical protein|nr:hypothetical protein [Actinomycetota bacterium]MBP6728104.1 hypothetical protein [Microthrixaceae bacterium]HMS11823.1 hypothetical protein [Microthrixaceae bacterium]HMT23272.1 hypothetical protein [Microthrixaceae bacterium]
MDEAPVKLGAMLYTLVDPNPGHEVAYNRWYERDHFYGGCMIGPGILAGARWVATREYKDLRFPADSGVAIPTDAGSYLATYWVQRGHEAEHFGWSSKQVFELYEAGRGFDERTHAHTALYTHQRAWGRDPDGVPVELALDHRFAGLVSVHVDRADGVKHAAFDEWFEDEGRALLLGTDSPIAIVCSWRPIIPRGSDGEAPMQLGSGPGTPQRSMQICFLDDAPKPHWDRFRAYAAAVDASGVARVTLAAPFLPTVPGTDRYTDQLW